MAKAKKSKVTHHKSDSTNNYMALATAMLSLGEEIDILREDMWKLQSQKRDEQYALGETNDVTEITLRISYNRDQKPPADWNWAGLIPGAQIDVLRWTHPHPDAPTW